MEQPTPSRPDATARAGVGDLTRYAANLQDEVDSAAAYRALADVEKRPQLATVYQRLAETEEKHAAFWAGRLQSAGRTVPALRPAWRTRVLIWLARRLGPDAVLPVLVGRERADVGDYARQPETRDTGMPGEEQSHGRLLRTIATTGGVEGSMLARLEGRHRAVGGNALRAAVLGANDGLVSNLSLVMGVAGAAAADRTLLITGLAGLLAGAGSMAMGEWLSVQSSRELNQRQLDVEAAEVAEMPEEEAEELALIYQAKGLPQPQAQALAKRLMADPASALDTLGREELGIDPEELGGSAWEAAVTSFVLFALGAIIPVIPFMFLTGAPAIATSVAVSALALFAIGAAITVLTGRSVLFSGTRQLLVGLGAAALTYGVGKLIGVSVAG